MLEPDASACLGASIVIGDVIADRYVIRAILGQGGMGVVCEAEHRQLGERVAIKLLVAGADRVPEARARFMREARVTAKLRSEHAARVTDFGVLDDGTPYMVMEYLEGLDLKRLLNEERELPVEVAIHYAVQICVGLAEAHALGIVHRDLKPSNLFVTERPDGSDLVKIVDFGVSKSLLMPETDDNITASGTILGSPRYMAPEQLEDAVTVDSRADIWSLGVVLYEMLAGHPPFTALSPATLCHAILSGERPAPLAGQVRGVTPELEAVVLGCLDTNLDTRIPNVGVLARSLSEATGIDGLDAAASRIDGILQRAPGNEASQSQAVLRNRDPRRRLGSTSSVSQVGPIAHTLRPRGRRSVLWVVIPAATLLAIAMLVVGLVRRKAEPEAVASSPAASVLGPPSASNVAPSQSAPSAPLGDGGPESRDDAATAPVPTTSGREASTKRVPPPPTPTVHFTAEPPPTAAPSPTETHDPFDDRF